MAKDEGILAKDLEKWSIEELLKLGMVTIKDPENLSEEMLQKLRSRYLAAQSSQAVELDMVNQRLQAFISQSGDDGEPAREQGANSDESSETEYTTPSWPGSVEFDRIRRPIEKEHYEALLAAGGRPSHDPEEITGLLIKRNLEQLPDIVKYWRYKTEGWFMMSTQSYHWENFRAFQDEKRRKYWKPKFFAKYTSHVDNILKSRNLEGANLSLNRSLQTKLDDWKEYQYRAYSQLISCERNRTEAARKLESEKQRLEAEMPEGISAEDREEILNQGLYWFTVGHRGSELSLSRQETLIKWVDEQVSLLASESAASVNEQRPDNTTEQGSSAKRKRQVNEIADGATVFSKRARRSETAREIELESRPGPRRSSRLAEVSRKADPPKVDRSQMRQNKDTALKNRPKQTSSRDRVRRQETNGQKTIVTRCGRISKPPDRYS